MAQRKEVERFRRVAWQRLEEGDFLISNGFNNAAIYLGGNAVECVLKAALLSTYSNRRHAEICEEFRGKQGHNFDWLRHRLSQRTGFHLNREMVRHLRTVASWSTDLRYEPKRIGAEVAQRFVNSARSIVTWYEGRLPHK